MKRTLLTLICSLFALAASADEGMWLPSLISQRIDDMRAKGFRLTAEDIYSINKASMKDAVVLFDGGCTGELISAEGLLLTNHHCGYDAIQSHSSVEHDYLTHGFWAMSRAQELPNEKLNVKFLVRMEEVTDRLAAGQTQEEIVRKAEAEGKGYKAAVEQMYYGNQQFLFVYEQFDDVRLVAAPPSSIGKFGGDTDNWIWPRHTGDFSLFRIYAGRDNKPAAYSPDNVPYKPKRHFKISTAGVGEGDFTMIYGFPGNTQEYILSDAVAYIAERSDPAKIAVRTGRLDIISAAQQSDPALRIHYAAKHASIANAWKKWQGEVLGINRLGTVASKRAYEQDFAAWAQDKPEYRSVVADLKAEYARIADAYFAREITRETLDALPKRYTAAERAEAVFAQREATERALYRYLFGEYARRCPVQYQAPEFLAGAAAAGSPEAFAERIFSDVWEGSDTTAVNTLARGAKRMQDHIEWLLGTRSLRNLNSARLNELYTAYIKGLREWDAGRAFFPDANLTLRVAYGHVAGVRIRRRRVSQAPDHDRRHRQGQPRHLRLRHSAGAARHPRLEGVRTLGHADRRPHDGARLLPRHEPHHGRKLRIADPQRTGRAGRRELRPHMAFDDERRGLRRDDLPQHSRGYPLRAVRDRPHRRRGLFVRRNGLRQEEIEKYRYL